MTVKQRRHFVTGSFVIAAAGMAHAHGDAAATVAPAAVPELRLTTPTLANTTDSELSAFRLDWTAAYTQPEPAKEPGSPAKAGTPGSTGGAAGGATEGAGDAAELAKKLSNPVASLISVPLQFNYDDGFGPKDAGRLTLNIQPVIPFSITEGWSLIVRTIVPVIYQGSLAEGIDSDFGMGDVTQSFFFSPKKEVGGWILAVGPVALWPTGTDPGLRSEQLGLGPTALALRQHDGWTYGILANHIFGVTGSDDHANVNSTFLQPFVSYTWSTATTLSLNTEAGYDWTAEQWTVPINLVVSQLVKVGGQPVQFFVGGRYYAETADEGPEWGVRFGFTLLFPK